MSRHQHAGNARTAVLAADIDDVATSLAGDALTGWSDGTVGKFYAVLGRGTPTMEKIEATNRSGDNLTGITRGVDGTTAVAHAAGTTLEHCITAAEFDAMDAHKEAGSGAHGYPAIDQLATLSGAQTLEDKTLHDTTFTGTTTGLPTPSKKLDLVAETATVTIADTTYANKVIKMTQTTAANVVLPSNSTAAYAVGDWIAVLVLGSTGVVAFTAGSGATVVGAGGLKARARYSQITAVKIDTDTWLVVGDAVV